MMTITIVTILILIDGFLQYKNEVINMNMFKNVTILILIDGFLQSEYGLYEPISQYCHNPYFNRWFSAI